MDKAPRKNPNLQIKKEPDATEAATSETGDDPTKLIEKLTGECLDLKACITEQDALIRDQADKIRDQADEIRDQADEIRDQADKIRDQADEIRDQADKIRDQADEIRGQADEIRGQADEIRGQADEIRGQADEIRGQADEIELLRQQLERFTTNDQGGDAQTPIPDPPPAGGSSRPCLRWNCWLCIRNMVVSTEHLRSKTRVGVVIPINEHLTCQSSGLYVANCKNCGEQLVGLTEKTFAKRWYRMSVEWNSPRDLGPRIHYVKCHPERLEENPQIEECYEVIFAEPHSGGETNQRKDALYKRLNTQINRQNN